MSEKGTIKLRGKDYVTFPGLLDKLHHHFHQTGNNWSIETEIPKGGVPSAENNYTAVVEATITEFYYTAESIKEVIRCTSGIGDANEGNVVPNIKPHIIRMAETRAKARAARDFLNVHGEEFAGEYHHEPEQAVTEQPRGSERKTELAVVDGELDDDYDNEVDEDAEERKALLDELVTLAGQLGFNQKQISRRLETKWLEEDLIELEQAASRMRMAVQEKEKPLDERG